MTNQVAVKIEISSGEGALGKVETYDGELNAESVLARLEAERCGGDRWAFARVDGQYIADREIAYFLRKKPSL